MTSLQALVTFELVRKVGREQITASLQRVRDQVRDPRRGLFGPGSAVWKIFGDPIQIIMSFRTVLLQLAHPYVAHGVDQHSLVRDDIMGRFERTADFVIRAFFGDLDQAIAAAEDLYQLHTTIRGTINEDVGVYKNGDKYQANEADALFWVYLTFFDSAIYAYETFVEELPLTEKNRFYEESKLFAQLFAIPDDIMPRDWPDFIRRRDEILDSGIISVGEPAARIKGFLYSAHSPMAAPAFRLAEIMTGFFLPEQLSAEFGFERGAAEGRVHNTALTLIRAGYRLVPDAMRAQSAQLAAEQRIDPTPWRELRRKIILQVELLAINNLLHGKSSANESLQKGALLTTF